MNGSTLTLGLVGALAAGAALGRRGSASATEARAVFRSPCSRCLGKGTIHPFSHILGGTCFACEGKGYIETATDPAILSARRDRSRAKATAAREARATAARAAAEEREARYRDDPRIGPQTRARMMQFPEIADEAFKALAREDAGEVPPNTLRNVRR